MLTIEQRFILSLLQECVKGEKSEEVSCAEYHIIKEIILRNSILLTVYQRLPVDMKKQFEKVYLANIKQAVGQKYEGERVLQALSDAGFSVIALKGWELRKLYPNPNMRQMADLDILVCPYEFDKIKTVMSQRGFLSGKETAWKHDSFRKQYICVEMHKRLTDDSDKIQAWEKNIWDRATVVNGNIYKMNPEDYYIFHFVHLHNDFLNGSLGLRRIVDTWLLQKQLVDMKTVRSSLESFGMGKFHEKMVKLSQVTMGDEPMDEDSEVLLKHAFMNGIYGTEKSYKAGRIVAMGGSLKMGKLNSKLAAVFLPYKRMKAQFPTLEKWPILLPYYWIKRIIRFLKGDMKKNRRKLDYSNVNEAHYEEMKRFFEAGGITESVSS